MAELSAVSIQNVYKSFTSVQALNGISFEISQGELFGLLGPNGAGKSTLINIMAGLTRATSGSVKVMGYDVASDYRQSRLSIGVVPQELVFDPFFPVKKFLRLQAGYFGLGQEAFPWIDELIESLELTDKADSTLRSLSGGMKRRVLIAQALVHRPSVIVLDEPTAGVDIELRQTLWKLIKRLHHEGHTILLTTHYLEEAEALCDRIAILHNGELKALESKTTLIDKHPERYVQVTFKDEDVTLPNEVKPSIQSVSGNTVCFRLGHEHNSIGHILRSLHMADINILDVETSAPGLEEIFLDIVSD